LSFSSTKYGPSVCAGVRTSALQSTAAAEPTAVGDRTADGDSTAAGVPEGDPDASVEAVGDEGAAIEAAGVLDDAGVAGVPQAATTKAVKTMNQSRSIAQSFMRTSRNSRVASSATVTKLPMLGGVMPKSENGKVSEPTTSIEPSARRAWAGIATAFVTPWIVWSPVRSPRPWPASAWRARQRRCRTNDAVGYVADSRPMVRMRPSRRPRRWRGDVGLERRPVTRRFAVRANVALPVTSRSADGVGLGGHGAKLLAHAVAHDAAVGHGPGSRERGRLGAGAAAGRRRGRGRWRGPGRRRIGAGRE
jgi:hypothetical protein